MSSSKEFQPVQLDHRGPPKHALPESEHGFTAGGYRVEIYPPLIWELPFLSDEYIVWASYSSARLSRSINDGPFEEIALLAGAYFFAPPGTKVRVKMLQPSEVMFVTADATKVEEIFNRVAGSSPWTPKVIENFSAPGLTALQIEIRRSLLQDGLKEPTYIGSLLNGVFSRLACKLLDVGLRAPARETLSPGILRRLISKIDEELDSQISVAELARAAGLSRSHFSRAFQSVTGEAPRDFIIGRKLNRARDLLVSTNADIGEIAMQSGFSSHSHLTSTFKQRLGLSPTEYRNSFDEKTSL